VAISGYLSNNKGAVILAGTCFAAELMIWHGWCLIELNNLGNRFAAALAGTLGIGIIATSVLLPVSLILRQFIRFRKLSPRRIAPAQFSIGDILWGMVVSAVVLTIFKWMGLLDIGGLAPTNWLKVGFMVLMLEILIGASAGWFVLSEVGWIPRLAPTLMLIAICGYVASISSRATAGFLALIVLVQWAYIVVILVPTRFERVRLRLQLSWR
jgi:hypothetical protein